MMPLCYMCCIGIGDANFIVIVNVGFDVLMHLVLLFRYEAYVLHGSFLLEHLFQCENFINTVQMHMVYTNALM